MERSVLEQIREEEMLDNQTHTGLMIDNIINTASKSVEEANPALDNYQKIAAELNRVDYNNELEEGTTTLSLSHMIHDLYGQSAGISFDFFLHHLASNDDKFIACAIFYDPEDHTKLIKLEAPNKPSSNNKTNKMGLSIQFLEALIKGVHWPSQLHTIHLKYYNNHQERKEVVFKKQ